MTPEQVAAWAASGESELLEFKCTTGQRREGTRTLCFGSVINETIRIVVSPHRGHLRGSTSRICQRRFAQRRFASRTAPGSGSTISRGRPRGLV